MKTPQLNRKQRMLVQCAPFNEEKIRDRGMRAAVFRVKKTEMFAHQGSGFVSPGDTDSQPGR
jgi:hypothetical protein